MFVLSLTSCRTTYMESNIRWGGSHAEDHINPDRPVFAAPHDLLQPTSLLITQPPRQHRLARPTSRTRLRHHKIECGSTDRGMSADR